MADEPEAEPLESDEGGPIKSFLEHLEDLRWVLIKSLSFAAVAMLICLLAGNYLVKLLEWPLEQAPVGHFGKTQIVKLAFGTNQLTSFQVGPQDPLAALLGTNEYVRLQMVPLSIGTNQVFGFTVEPEVRRQQKLQIQIINLSPAGAFVVATKVAFYGGLVFSAPFIFYFIAQFVFPALKMREKKYIYLGLLVGSALFAIGVCFCYFILMPIALAASVQYAEWLGFAATQWRAEDYIGFVCKFMLGMGLGFEMPVVVLTLVKIGVLNYRSLANARRYVIIISFVLGAILTTPEVITQVMMAIPLLFLYEVSVWIAWYWEQEDRAKARRRLAFALVVAVALGYLLWLAYQHAGPWLRQLGP